MSALNRNQQQHQQKIIKGCINKGIEYQISTNVSNSVTKE